MSLDPKAKEWSFLSRSSCLKLNQISFQMAESHVIPVLLIILKIGAFLVIPVSLIGAFIILIALLGKFIRQFLTKKS